MKNRTVKRILAAGLTVLLAVSMLAGCGGTGKESGDGVEFTWWIFTGDGKGQYYEGYDESPVVQYVNQQYWDIENGGLGTKETGKKLNLSFMIPIAGSERDNYNTMIATGEYPEIVSMHVATESAQAMCESGVLVEVTEYIEKYMPNYLAYLEKNPELVPLSTVQDEEGNTHYYAIYSFVDGVEEPWEGTCYRRDWIVKYAQPSEYVWDWESAAVKENGHPAVTPLSKALAENDLEGWKKNDVTKFEVTSASNTNEEYEDNVIFPSGTADPLTISDWEWMLEAFDKAITERGWADDSSAYGYSIPYYGYSQMGDLTSSFGGGTGAYYNNDGQVEYDGDSENFRTYLECVSGWYEKGWLDSEFNTRASDMFYQINSAGVNQGKVGMWCGMLSMIGTSIRTSCQDASDAEDAFVMGCALPINDVYGTEDQMYKEPDALYQSSRKGAGVGITSKIKEKSEEELATLFTYLDWAYTMEGAQTIRLGLTEEQLASAEFDPDVYAENGVKSAYELSETEDGRPLYTLNIDKSNPLFDACIGQRMDVGRKPFTNSEYVVDRGNPEINQKAIDQWTKYRNTGNVLDYTALLNTDEAAAYSKISTALTDYQSQNVPNVIKGTMSWDDYVAGVDKLNPDSAVEYLQKYVDLANAARGEQE